MPTLTKSKRSAAKNAAAEEGIVVTCQQSRFHVDADEAPTSKDIDIRDLTVSVGGKEIVEHINLALKEGGRYALVGKNGLGKSTILKALAERRIASVALNLRILLLGQTRIDTDEAEDDAEDQAGISVLQSVVSSDRKRERMINDRKLLSTALEVKSEVSDTVIKTVRQLKLEEAERKLDDARLIAERRSGARGSRARQVLIESENAVERAQELYNATCTADDLQTEMDAAVTMLEDLQISLDAMDASATEARARSVLIGLGFSELQIDGPLSNLSGGWQTRASLAAALVQQTDVLLLDEPTNFLDLPAVIWLQHYLVNTLSESTTLVVTTHDRDFTDAVADHLIILRQQPPKSIETFKGVLSDYVAEKHRQIKRMTKMSAAHDRKQKHMESTISKSLTAAKRTGDDKKLKQAASRRKKMEERSGLEVSAKGHRFKLNRDLGYYNTKNRADIEIPEFDPTVHVSFIEQPPPLRNISTLASIENVSFTYPKTKKQILDNVSLNIHPGSRTAIVGLNGSGKSTLVNLLTSSTYKPTSGALTLHPMGRIAHYTQHHPTTLQTLSIPELPSTTPLSYLMHLHPELPEPKIRATLSGLSLHPSYQTTPLSSLSGGQLVRVSLATCLLPTPPHLFILDEPTTHLDSDTIVALISALKRYTGAILIVSHDRFFIRCTIEGQSARGYRDADPDDHTNSNDNDSYSDQTTSDTDEDEEVDLLSARVKKPNREPGKVYRMTKSGRLLALDGGMDAYENLIVKQLTKRGIEVT